MHAEVTADRHRGALRRAVAVIQGESDFRADGARAGREAWKPTIRLPRKSVQTLEGALRNSPWSDEPLTAVEQVTPAWLTATLAGAGVLDSGEVLEVTPVVWSTHFCVLARLEVRYGAPTRAPVRFILKFTHPQLPPSPLERGWEVLFYTQVAPHTRAPLPRCCHAALSADRHRSHLLLEDLSSTHVSSPPSHLPPPWQFAEQIVDALADVHASWWERPPYDVLDWQPLTPAALDARIADVRARMTRFLTFLGDRLSPARHDHLSRVLNSLPRLYRRLLDPAGYTVVHDDVHVGNVLFPKDPQRDTIRLIDWQTWHIDLAAKDLAHMMALFWFPDVRARWERPLLERYLARLRRRGVAGYTSAALWDDYRLAVVRMLFYPAWQWQNGHSPNIWWNNLERAFAAFDDLGCDTLL